MQKTDKIKTLTEIPDKLMMLDQDRILLRNCEGKSWSRVTIKEFYQAVEDVALGILSLKIQKGDRIAIYSDNCCQWLIADFAIQTCGAVTVPIFPTLPSDQIQFILQNSGAKGIFLSNKKELKKIKSLQSLLPDLEWIVTFEEAEITLEHCWTFEQFIEEGRRRHSEFYEELQRRKSSIRPDHIASIIYTSGTTGIPKGVMLSQDNFLSNIEATVNLVEFSSRDIGLSFLPLSHVFERMADYKYLYHGATIAFSAVDKIMKHCAEIHPTVTASVPRVFEIMQEKILSRLSSSSALKRTLFQWGMTIGRKRGNILLAGKKPSWVLQLLFFLAKNIVFRKLHKNLGKRFRFFISGGGPLPSDIGEFFFAMGVIICEGYGLTETSPVVAVNTPQDVKFGTVGKVVDGVEVRIAEDGEILVKGPNVMKGYYKNEAATRDTFRNGWFCTGDIGELTDGYLIIKERKKDIIVTSSGKNISPQRIENFLKRSPLINNAVVFGDAMDYISALIVPNFETLREKMGHLGMPPLKTSELIRNEKIMDLYRKEIFAGTRSLASYEKVRRFVLMEKDFSIENGEITPTMKVKRSVVSERYRHLIESMYQESRSAEKGSHDL